MNQLDRLFEMMMSPAGIAVAIAIPLVIVLIVNGTIWQARLVGVVCFLSVLARFQNEWEISGDLAPGLNEVREYGRFMALGLAVLLAGVMLVLKPRIPRLSAAVVGYLVLQAVISVSYGLVGNWFSAVLQFPFAVTSGLIIAYILEDTPEENTEIVREIILVASALFVGATLIQYAINPGPMFLSGGLFTGLTGNPQHAAVFLAIIIVATFTFAIERVRGYDRWLFGMIGMSAVVLLILSGSRTGVAMTGVGFIAYFIPSRHRIVPVIGLLIASVGVLYMVGVFDMLPDSKGVGKLTGGDLTSRDQVWRAQIKAFIREPLFGKPFPEVGRHRFGESSWFGAAGAMGLMGLIPMLFAAIAAVVGIVELTRLPLPIRQRWQAGLVVSGLATVFLGSIAEAYLLAVATVPVLWMIVLLQTMMHANRYDYDDDEVEADTFDEEEDGEYSDVAEQDQTSQLQYD